MRCVGNISLLLNTGHPKMKKKKNKDSALRQERLSQCSEPGRRAGHAVAVGRTPRHAWLVMKRFPKQSITQSSLKHGISGQCSSCYHMMPFCNYFLECYNSVCVTVVAVEP